MEYILLYPLQVYAFEIGKQWIIYVQNKADHVCTFIKLVDHYLILLNLFLANCKICNDFSLNFMHDVYTY